MIPCLVAWGSFCPSLDSVNPLANGLSGDRGLGVCVCVRIYIHVLVLVLVIVLVYATAESRRGAGLGDRHSGWFDVPVVSLFCGYSVVFCGSSDEVLQGEQRSALGVWENEALW